MSGFFHGDFFLYKHAQVFCFAIRLLRSTSHSTHTMGTHDSQTQRIINLFSYEGSLSTSKQTGGSNEMGTRLGSDLPRPLPFFWSALADFADVGGSRQYDVIRISLADVFSTSALVSDQNQGRRRNDVGSTADCLLGSVCPT